jgi:hypothetical protein
LHKSKPTKSLNFEYSDTDHKLLDNVHKFIAALKSIHFKRDFLGCLRNDSRSELLQALGQIPSLQQVDLADVCLLVSDISLLLMQAKSLRVLKMNKLVLQGVEKDFDAYEMAFLPEFEMEQCIAAVKTISLDKMEQAGKKHVSAAPATGAPMTQVQNIKNARSA